MKLCCPIVNTKVDFGLETSLMQVPDQNCDIGQVFVPDGVTLGRVPFGPAIGRVNPNPHL